MNTDLNHLKNSLLTEFETLSQSKDYATFNATHFDVTTLSGHFHIDMTTFTGLLNGLHVNPPVEVQTPTAFQLDAFFDAADNLLNEEPLPKVSIIGGCNGTHTLTLTTDTATPSLSNVLQDPQDHIFVMT